MNTELNRKLKICHIITRMIVGGAQENTLLTIIDHVNKGHEVILITGKSPGPEGELLRNKNFPDFETVINPHLVREISLYHDIAAYSSLKKYLRDNNVDVVHTHSSKAGVIGRAAAWAAKVPFVCHTVHGQAFHRYETLLKNFIYKASERWAAKRCHRIYAVAEAMIKQCLDAGIAPSEKYMTVYSGMELENFLNSDSNDSRQVNCEMRKSLGIPEKVPVISTVARLFPLKGYEYLVPAARIITEKFPDTYFLIVGDGIMTDEVKNQAKKFGLNFVFSGLVPPSEVYKYIAVSDMMIHLSLREGLPRAIVQALASGKPAIGFDLDGTPEVVINGETGFIAEPKNYEQVADFAIQIIGDRQLMKKLGDKGRELVKQKFGWKRMGNILEQEYLKGVGCIGN
jgi:glycosyltransferase involved in cell wall biosynthesis